MMAVTRHDVRLPLIMIQFWVIALHSFCCRSCVLLPFDIVLHSFLTNLKYYCIFWQERCMFNSGGLLVRRRFEKSNDGDGKDNQD